MPPRPRKKLKTDRNFTQRSTAKNLNPTTSKAPATNRTATTTKAPAKNLTATTTKAPVAAAKTTRTNVSPTNSRTPSFVLPNQYRTPARENGQSQMPQTPQIPVPNFSNPSAGAHHVRQYPPPKHLFQSSTSVPQRRNSGSRSFAPSGSPSTSENVALSSDGHNSHAPSLDGHNSHAPSPDGHNSHAPSSQGHNYNYGEHVLPDLEEDALRALDALLRVPDRHLFVPYLHPNPNVPNSTWYGSIIALLLNF